MQPWPRAGILSAGEVLATGSGVGRHGAVAGGPVAGGVLEALVVRLALSALGLAGAYSQRPPLKATGSIDAKYHE
jgi:hypothetical protein